MEDIQVDHLRVKVRPKLNVVVRAFLDFFLKFSIQTFKSNNNSDIKLGKVAATIQSLGFFRCKTTFSILSNKVLLDKPLGSVDCKLLLEVSVTLLSYV